MEGRAGGAAGRVDAGEGRFRRSEMGPERTVGNNPGAQLILFTEGKAGDVREAADRGGVGKARGDEAGAVKLGLREKIGDLGAVAHVERLGRIRGRRLAHVSSGA
jgi:hypothetical protein